MVLHLVDEVGETEPKLKPYTWQGHWRAGQQPRSFRFGEGIAGVAWATKKAYVSHGDVRNNELYIPSGSVEEGGARSLLAVPMLDARERCFGVFSLGIPVAGWFQERLGDRVRNLEISSNLLLQAVSSKMHVGLKSSIDYFLLGFRAAISGDPAP